MENKEFVHLHLHTEYSLLDGSGNIEKMVSRAKELGMKAIAITDHGAMYGTIDFYKACKKEGIKPIIGCEIYVAARSMNDKTLENGNKIHHLVLLVKNEIGYQNLMKIVSYASIDGFYYKPRVDYEFLMDKSEGLIALSACLGGEVQNNLMNGNIEKAYEVASKYKELFGEDFYIELQDHGLEEQKRVNNLNIKLAEDLGIKLVCTNDVHYINKDDYKAHDVLLCIQTASSVDDEDRMRYPSHEFYLKSAEEMYDLFSEVPEALENTVKIADMCNYDYVFHESKLPKFDLPEDIDHFVYLRERCFEGLIKKYDVFSELRKSKFNGDIIKKLLSFENDEAKSLVKRLEYELSVINQMGFVDYFLIVWDFIRFADESNIPTGAGRGSAAGSIVSYCLNITKIDPIKYNLIFERFLNPERISMPDIDSDFCYVRRQEVIDYVVQKYGKDNVSQIITFGTMAARACIRDVGRAMNYPYGEVDQIAKMIPSVLNITIDKALEINPELKDAYNTQSRVKDLIDVARNLEGLPRHSSTHAAGVVISGKPLVEYVPLQKNDESLVTQFTMTTLEELGLLKMDFLGLRTLTVLQEAVEHIKRNHGIDIDINNLPLDDPKVYEMIGEGKTVGCFQLESAGMTAFMKELKPESLEDIIAGISLYRPGPMSEIPRYIEAKRDRSKVTYITPELENILGVSYGVMIYQEQVMQIVTDLAGYSIGRADLVRRAMSKKKHDVMEKERVNFIEGIVKVGKIEVEGTRRRGISDDAANKIFDQMSYFASYAFNKSHAAAYAVIAYQTSYLMRYYPAEFICAMLNSFIGSNEKADFYIRYAKSIGITLNPPDINYSYRNFTVDGNSIRFGLAGIKNVGFSLVDSIVEARKEKGKFESFKDFVAKMENAPLNKRACECFIKAGAFDRIEPVRSQTLAVFEKIIDIYSTERKKTTKGQVSFFGGEDSEFDFDIGMEIIVPDIREFEKKEMLQMEKEMTGLYLTGHPLDEFKEDIEAISTISISQIISEDAKSLDSDVAVKTENIDLMEKSDLYDGQNVVIGAIVNSLTRRITKNNQIMAMLRVEDLTGSCEVIVFPKSYEKIMVGIKEEMIVAIKGRLQIREDEDTKIIAEEVIPLEKGKAVKFKSSFNRNNFVDRGNKESIRFNTNADIHNTKLQNPEKRQNLGNNQSSINVNIGIHQDDKIVRTSDEIIYSKGNNIIENNASNKSYSSSYMQSIDDGKTVKKVTSGKKLFIQFESIDVARKILSALKPVLINYTGNTPIYIYAMNEKRAYIYNDAPYVDESSDVVEILSSKLGKENVKVV